MRRSPIYLELRFIERDGHGCGEAASVTAKIFRRLLPFSVFNIIHFQFSTLSIISRTPPREQRKLKTLSWLRAARPAQSCAVVTSLVARVCTCQGHSSRNVDRCCIQVSADRCDLTTPPFKNSPFRRPRRSGIVFSARMLEQQPRLRAAPNSPRRCQKTSSRPRGCRSRPHQGQLSLIERREVLQSGIRARRSSRG
jgi:hypothetical protein